MLASERLLLRAVSATDGPAILHTLDDEVRQAQGYDDEAVAAIVASVPQQAETTYGGCPMSFVVTRPGLAEVVGVYDIYVDPEDPEIPTLGWWLHGSARGQGLGRESLALVLRYVHKHLGLPYARMGTNVDNHRARAQIEAVGAYESLRSPRQLPNRQTIQSIWFEHEG